MLIFLSILYLKNIKTFYQLFLFLCFIRIMKMQLFNNINFSRYKSSKYSYPETKNSILEGTSPSSTPDNIDLSDFQSLYDYSNERIRNLYKYYMHNDLTRQYTVDYADKVINKLEAGGIESSYMEIILELVDEEKLSPYVLDDITGQLNSNAVKDIDKLYDAYAENKDPADVFVPHFEDEIKAEKSLETGEVCIIGDDKNISIKLQDNSFKKLFITPKTYLELFPPVERFIITQSGRLGDCYLLSSIDSINQNLNTRYKLLEMFRENEDGTVDIAFSGFKDNNGEIVQTDTSKTIVKDISKEILKIKDDKITSFTTEGVKAVEILYEKMKSDEAKSVIEKRYNDFKELQNSPNRIALDENNIFWMLFSEDEVKEKQKKLEQTKSVIIPSALDWKTVTDEELDYFCSFYEKGEEMFAVIDDKWSFFKITKDKAEEKLAKVQNKDDDFSKYEALVLKRIIHNVGGSTSSMYFSNEVLPKRMILDLFNNITKFDLLYATAGREEDAFKNFGFVDTFKEPLNSDFVKEKLFTQDVSKYIFTCSSRQDNSSAKIPLYYKHAYSLSPVDTENGRMFSVRDPHNTLNEVILNYEELCEYFDTVDCGKLL